MSEGKKLGNEIERGGRDSDEELLKKLSQKISQHFHTTPEEEEKQRQEWRKTDLALLHNTVAPHLSQWYMEGDPTCIGKKFVVIRSWQSELIKQDSQYQGRLPIIIDPGIAFGWAHPTTSVSLELLEQHWQGGAMLDVGTGTGILAIVGSLLYPGSHIDAYDISLDIIENAELCLEVNDVLDKVNLKQADIVDYPEGFYDVITANLLPNIFALIKQELVKRLKPGGKLILSGFSDQIEARTLANFDWVQTVEEISVEDNDVAGMFQKLGLELIERKNNKHWLGLVMQLPKKN